MEGSTAQEAVAVAFLVAFLGVLGGRRETKPENTYEKSH